MQLPLPFRHPILALCLGLSASLASPAWAVNPQPVGDADINAVGNVYPPGEEETGWVIGDVQSTSGSVGAIWRREPLPTGSDWSSTVHLVILRTYPYLLSSEGLSFALQGQGINALGAPGSSVGYDTLGAVGMVLRTATNNQIGLNTSGVAQDTRPAMMDLGHGGGVSVTATLKYKARTHKLTLKATYIVDSHTKIASETATIDLAARFGPTVSLGVTGSTGATPSLQRVYNWVVDLDR